MKLRCNYGKQGSIQLEKGSLRSHYNRGRREHHLRRAGAYPRRCLTDAYPAGQRGQVYRGRRCLLRLLLQRGLLRHADDRPYPGAFPEYADTETAPFALLFEIEGDEKATRRVLYYCKVGVPGEDADGQAQKTPKTEAMDITASALADGRTRARTMENTRDEVFNNWFKSVWEPKMEPVPVAQADGPAPGGKE